MKSLPRVTVGNSASGTIAEPPLRSGTGILNLLDGGGLHGWRGIGSTPYYFFVGEGSRINIRDGFINWCTEVAFDAPILLSPGAELGVELTDKTGALSRTRPLIRSGANAGGAEGLNIITDAVLDLSLAGSYVHEPWTDIVLFKYDGELEGEFADLGEGDEFFLGENRFKIHYGSRSDSAITLRACGPYGTTLMVR